MSDVVKPLKWENDSLVLVDQRYLPHRIEYKTSHTIEDVHASIKDMVVRGAPLIGFSALYGMALWLRNQSQLREGDVDKARIYLESARPTAVNLAYEAMRAQKLILNLMIKGANTEVIYSELVEFAAAQIEQLGRDNLFMAQTAAKDLEARYGTRPLKLVTLCNTGFLACGPMGTALGVISHLHSLGRVEHVYACETRPYLQGSRLTAFELSQEKIPHHLIVEGAMSHLMRTQKIDAIFIGADRIVANGDTANKVGSSTLSIVAKHYGVPFFVVAPTSSFDMNLKHGSEIEVEMRNPDEILSYNGNRIAPLESQAFNPSFDITSHEFISGIISENGMATPVTNESLERMFKQ